MRWPVFGVSVVGILCLIAHAPASAWGSGGRSSAPSPVIASVHASRAHSLNRSGARTVAAQLFRFPQGLRFNRRIPVRGGFWPLSIWPDGVLTSQYDVPPVHEVPEARPEVI